MTDRNPGPAAEPGRPKRVRVVLADRRPAPAPRRALAEVDQQTEVGRLLVRGLIRSQLAAALRIAGVAVLLLGSWPALLALFPDLSRVRLIGLPLPWLVLGLLASPLLYLLARVYARQAERNEQEFCDLIEQG